MAELLGIDRDLGRIYVPPSLVRGVSLPGRPARHNSLREVGIFVAKQRRSRYEGARLMGYDTLWASVVHNERVDAGALKSAKQLFAGGSGTPGAPSATLYPKVIALANATTAPAKGHQSLGTNSADVTTNEFTTIGLTRVAATAPVGGDYTAPSALGSQYAQVLAKQFTASGSGTVIGAGIFDSTTVVGSLLYCEQDFTSNAVLVSGDLLTVTFTISN